MTILLRAIRKGLWGSPELVDGFVNIGESAFTVLPLSNYSGILISFRQFWKHLLKKGQDPKTLFDQTGTAVTAEDDPETLQRKESLSAVAALFFNECFHTRVEHESYEEALAYFAKAVALWSASQSARSGELDMVKAADCCERLLSEGVSSWQTVAESCELISESITYFPESDDLDPMIDITGVTGQPWAVINYWRHVASVAETNMSPSELKQYSEAETRTRHGDRLQRDFLWDVWEYLEPQSRRELIDAEINWHEAPKQGGTPYAVPSRLKLAFEYELQSMVFSHIKDSLRQILSDPQLRRELKLTSKDPKTLGSREMADLLEQVVDRKDTRLLSVRVFIGNLPLSSDDKSFLCDGTQLPQYLKRLAEVRRKPEHRIIAEQLMDEIREIRSVAFGIGQPSYLRRLANIKRKIASSSLTKNQA